MKFVVILSVFWINLTLGCTFTPPRLLCTTHLPSHPTPQPHNITTLEFNNIQDEQLDLDLFLTSYPQIHDVSIIGGNITRIIPPRTRPPNNVTTLRLVGVGVVNLKDAFLRSFPKLELLDLRGNLLKDLEGVDLTSVKEIYLADNQWNCSTNLSWSLNTSNIKDIGDLLCWGSPHSKRHLTTIANFTADLHQHCPPKCTCTLPKVVPKNVGSSFLEPIVEVNCIKQAFKSLPSVLPRKTKILRLDHNEIDDLKIMVSHPVYNKLLDLYLDFNKIKSVDVLEGSSFLKNFRVFSLRGNNVTVLPTYALDNSLEQNPHMPNALRLYLAGNPWRCDCGFFPVFQEMLWKYAPQVKDVEGVRCGYGDENSLKPILEITRSDVCKTEDYTARALDLLNGVLASAIVFILGKLAYDYYYFKKAGRLPWIVTKMP